MDQTPPLVETSAYPGGAVGVGIYFKWYCFTIIAINTTTKAPTNKPTMVNPIAAPIMSPTQVPSSYSQILLMQDAVLQFTLGQSSVSTQQDVDNENMSRVKKHSLSWQEDV